MAGVRACLKESGLDTIEKLFLLKKKKSNFRDLVCRQVTLTCIHIDSSAVHDEDLNKETSDSI